MVSPIEIAVSALVLAVAGFTIGAIGFGFGLTTTPVLLLYLDPQTVVIVVNAVAVLAFGLVLIETREHVPYRELTPTAIAGALGAPIGVYGLSALDPSALRIGISVLVSRLRCSWSSRRSGAFRNRSSPGPCWASASPPW